MTGRKGRERENVAEMRMMRRRGVISLSYELRGALITGPLLIAHHWRSILVVALAAVGAAFTTRKPCG